MSEPVTSYLAPTDRLGSAPVGQALDLGPADRLHDDLAVAAPDLVSTGVVVLTHDGFAGTGSTVTVVGERRMLHHLASAADVEIPVRLLAASPLPAEQVDAILSRTMLQVLVAVS